MHYRFATMVSQQTLLLFAILALADLTCWGQAKPTTAVPMKPPQTQQQPSGKIPMAPPPLQLASTISGFVAWDTTKIQPVKPGDCSPLEIYAVKGVWSQANPAPVGQTKYLPYRSQGNLGVCPFEITGAPVGVGLTVHYGVLNGSFKPPVVAFGQTGQFEIPGGVCGAGGGGPQRGDGTRTTVDGIVVCGNTASNVNLQLVALSSVAQPMDATTGGSKVGALTANSQTLRPASGIMGPGTISGVVWWDARTVETAPAPMGDVCDATGVTVVVNEIVKGQPFPSPVKVGSTPQWSSLLGSGSGSLGTKILGFGSIVGCVYTISGLPVKTDLTVLVNPSGTIFLPRGGGNLPHAVGTNSKVNIPGGSCPAAPPPPSTLAQFHAPRVYCGNGAYNVNFSLAPTRL